MESQTKDPIIELTIPSHPRFLQLVRGVMAKVTKILSIPSEQADYIILAVDEACSNIIRHSDTDEDGRIDFLITPGKKKLEICIMNYGKPWTPGKVTLQAPSKIKPGGLGRYIIHQVMDQIHYCNSDKDGNTIRMVKIL